MAFASRIWKKLSSPWSGRPAVRSRRRPTRLDIAWDCLEERTVLSHIGGLHPAHVAPAFSGHSHTGGGDSDSGAGKGSHSSSISTARQTLDSDIQKIETDSDTTIGELTTLHSAFQTLKSDGLKPTSQKALATFENNLVTALASGTALTDNTTLLNQFIALYTGSPTTQQTTDLTAAYNALAAAVTSSNISQADITTIANDFSALTSAQGGSSTATFPYFNLVTGAMQGPGGGQNGLGSGCGNSQGGSGTSDVSTARQTLSSDIQTIEAASDTTIGELTTLHTAFQTLKSDGLKPSRQKDLASFENNLVTANASGTTLAGNTTLLNQFIALYSSSPTTQQTTDLTAAYNALASAVTSTNISQANITTISGDWSALLNAEGSSSTASFPYFSLVTGQFRLPGGEHGGRRG